MKKTEFLKLKNYEEFDERREEFKGLKVDADIKAHMNKIFPKTFAPPDKHTDVSIKK